MTRNRVASTDGSAAWFFAARPEPKLVNIFTGAATHLLPPLPAPTRAAMDSFRGIVYGDGTIFLYTFCWYRDKKAVTETVFTAAILRPGETSWTVMEKRLDIVARGDGMYHDGKVMVCAGDSLWCFHLSKDNLTSSRWIGDHDASYYHKRSYILESQGEILWASVLMNRNLCRYTYKDPSPTLRVTVRALQEDPGGGGMRWVAKDGHSLGNRVLFLGSPASFGKQLDISNGDAYFVYRDGVFRYNFIDDATKLVKWLPYGLRSDDGELVRWPRAFRMENQRVMCGGVAPPQPCVCSGP